MSGEAAPKGWSHDDLAIDLAAHLRCGGEHYTWFNIALGSGDARPDVFALRPFSYSSPQMVSYECKVSASDLRADLTSGKWQKYLAFSQGVTFAVPEGLVRATEIPAACGLIIRSARGWRHARRPTLQEATLPTSTMLKLISSRPHRGGMETYRFQSGRHWDEQQRLRRDAESRILAHARLAVGKRLGEDIARYLVNPQAARDIIARAQADADEIRASAEASVAERRKDLSDEMKSIAETLGLPPGSNWWTVRAALHDVRRRLSREGEVAAVQEAAKEAMRALGRAMRLNGSPESGAGAP